MMADIVVFDPAKVKDISTYARPKQFPEGIETVLVNGTPVLVDGSGRRPGQDGRCSTRCPRRLADPPAALRVVHERR